MKKHAFTLVFLLSAVGSFAGNITFSGQVANIIYNNCTSCHRPGAIAPFTLTSYEDVFNNRFAIAGVLQNQTMPPWSPNPNYTHFANERTLTPQQIGEINEWLLTGAQRGDVATEPQPPVFNDGPQLPNPDFSKKIETHTVTTNTDDFELFALQSDLTQDAMIKQIELLPGNRQIVHHIFVFLDSTGDFKRSMDNGNTSLTTFAGNNYISGGTMSELKLIGGWLPGGNSLSTPDNMGYRVPAGSWYILQIHYAPGSNGQSDATTLNLKYDANAAHRQMDMKPLLDNVENMSDGPIFIPANTTKTFHEQFTVPDDISLISITPHMHKIGKHMKVVAFAGGSTADTIRLVDDRWDFHWQGMYTFPKVVHLHAGDVIWAEGFYDNTVNNHDNPFYPIQDIQAGTSTLTEMMQVFFCFTPYQTGDENIVLSDNIPSLTDLNSCSVFPNPVTNGQTLSVSVDPHVVINSVAVYSIDGRLLQTYLAPFISNEMDVKLPQLANGMYILQVTNAEATIRKKILVNNVD